MQSICFLAAQISNRCVSASSKASDAAGEFRCPPGYTCFKDTSSNTQFCYLECNGQGASQPLVNNQCPAGTTQIFGACCAAARFHTSRLASLLPDRHVDHSPQMFAPGTHEKHCQRLLAAAVHWHVQTASGIFVCNSESWWYRGVHFGLRWG